MSARVHATAKYQHAGQMIYVAFHGACYLLTKESENKKIAVWIGEVVFRLLVVRTL